MIGMVHQRPADRDALAHAAGQLVRIAVLETGEADRAQQLAGACLGVLAVHAARFGLQHDVAQGGAPVEQHGALKHDADVGARPVDSAAAHPHRAARRRQQSGGDHQQRALAAAARADMGDELAAALAERHVAERADLAVARRINLGQVLDAQIRPIVFGGDGGGGGEGAHAQAAAQACCGRTYSAPVGTNSLVKTWSVVSGAVTPPYCLSTAMAAFQSSVEPQHIGLPLVFGVTQVFHDTSNSPLMMSTLAVSEYFLTVAAASSGCWRP